MKAITAFIQTDGKPDLIEVDLPEDISIDDLAALLKRHGIDLSDNDEIFIDEADEPLKSKGKDRVPSLRRGCRIHVTRCRKIRVSVNFLGRTETEAFAPGVRVRRVKAWSARVFRLDDNDVSEHVLQLCNSTVRPPTDTPLHELTDRLSCSICFDLVPEKRVEG
ncbi:MAG: hypothetical protein CVT83_01180 [Alphaproteobacteria bacterium HGW-Alphaproteobacteria-5]|nr:MAG: hypothetical protein CVT83_01180 [Alphaproteobacteria bacterium HGW-Alphaproteobacteria-5]